MKINLELKPGFLPLFKFIDCVATVVDDDGEETGDRVAGLTFGYYEISRGGRTLYFSPGGILAAVDRAIAQEDYPPEYVI
jgi:hypothetical protein